MKKKIISLFSAVALSFVALSAKATGGVGVDPVQTGSLTFSVATGSYITNTFPFPYTTAPVVQLFAGTTNATPITNVFVTATNFAVGVNATNPPSQVVWQSFVGYPRVITGTNAIQASLLLTNTFSTPFAYAPVVQISWSSTNAVTGGGPPAISSVTPTQFVVQFGNTNNIIYWGALGVSANPGSYNPNYPQITY